MSASPPARPSPIAGQEDRYWDDGYLRVVHSRTRAVGWNRPHLELLE